MAWGVPCGDGIGGRGVARIDRFTSRAQAQLACGLLTAHGIDAYVSGDDAGGAYPQLAYGIGGIVLVVPDEQVDAARDLLDEHLSDAEVDAAAAMADVSDEAMPAGSVTGLAADDARDAAAPPGRPGHADVERQWRWVLVVALVVLIVALVVTTR